MGAADAVRMLIAARAAQELRDGEVVNLGAGMPMLVANYVPAGVDLIIHTENGVIGAGPISAPGAEDRDRRNAGNLPIDTMPGACYVDSVLSFGLIRGGHVDATMLGILQVDEQGNIANYETGSRIIGMGGAMDLVAGANGVYVLTEHCNKTGAPKLVRRCTLPLTGVDVCDVIITERAVFRRWQKGGFVLEEVACGHTLEEIAACTEMTYTVSENVVLDAYGSP